MHLHTKYNEARIEMTGSPMATATGLGRMKETSRSCDGSRCARIISSASARYAAGRLPAPQRASTRAVSRISPVLLVSPRRQST